MKWSHLEMKFLKLCFQETMQSVSPQTEVVCASQTRGGYGQVPRVKGLKQAGQGCPCWGFSLHSPRGRPGLSVGSGLRGAGTVCGFQQCRPIWMNLGWEEQALRVMHGCL